MKPVIRRYRPDLGLYLVVETYVPENVFQTTAPFFVSLPMTAIDGQDWNYDVTVYPKNETDMPTLEKTLRESKPDTGKHNGATDDITDGYAHTGTGSDGDVVDYQIISTLPTITSNATASLHTPLSIHSAKALCTTNRTSNWSGSRMLPAPRRSLSGMSLPGSSPYRMARRTRTPAL